jgi:integrase
MPRLVFRQLTANSVQQETDRGMHADGNGLYLQVTRTGHKSWVYRYSFAGRRYHMGLGPVYLVSLAAARENALDLAHQLRRGINPIAVRQEARAAAQAARARSMTFRAATEAYIAAHEIEWTNPGHARDWKNSVETYAYPVCGDLPVANVDTAVVMRILEPIWTDIRVTAARLRGRVELILDWAKTAGYRSGENPARWRGHLKNLLAKPPGRGQKQHHPALPYDEIAAFVAALKQRPEKIEAAAFEYLILMAARTKEVIGMRWSELNREKTIWTIPAARFKTRIAYRQPVSEPARAILLVMERQMTNDFVFAGTARSGALPIESLRDLQVDMGGVDYSVHGLRSTFRDWAAERTNFAREIVEMCLSHDVKGETEAAYWRSDIIEKRRRCMEAWAKVCALPPATSENKIVAISR